MLIHIPVKLVDVAANQVLHHTGDNIAKMRDQIVNKIEKKSETKIEAFLYSIAQVTFLRVC